MTTPRIYVASLSDYNAGRLHGAWIDAAQPAADISAEVETMLASSTEPGAEEWAIHDYEGFGTWRMSEWESFDVVSAVAMAIVEHGEAFAAWIDYYGGRPDEAIASFVEAFEDSYLGEWANVNEYVEDLVAQGALGEPAMALLEERPGWVDVAQIANDLILGGDIWTVDAPNCRVWVFGS